MPHWRELVPLPGSSSPGRETKSYQFQQRNEIVAGRRPGQPRLAAFVAYSHALGSLEWLLYRPRFELRSELRHVLVHDQNDEQEVR